MKRIFFITIALRCFQSALCYGAGGYLHTQEVASRKAGENTFRTGKSMVIPLLDIGVLWAENNLVRTKRNPTHEEIKQPYGGLDWFMKSPKEKDQIKKNKVDSRDAFVDSLVSMMSKSDPGLLLKLRKRIDEFEGEHKMKKVQKKDRQRPLIQFFNVTRISVSSPDEEDRDGLNFGEGNSFSKMEEIVQKAGKKFGKKEIDQIENKENSVQVGVNDLGANPVSDMTYLKTKDGQARIQRSKDRRRYRLEIDYTSDHPPKEKRNIRTVKNQNYVPDEVQFGRWQSIVGHSPKDKLVKYSIIEENDRGFAMIV